MGADLIVLPIEEIREAARDLAAGLGRGEMFTAEQWDRSVSTLARCHDQVGGETRRQVYEIFAACAESERSLDVDGQLERLVVHLRRTDPRAP